MARWFAVETPLPAAKPELTALAAGFVTDDRPGDWAQALMDLGATICRPKSPACEACPVSFGCAAGAGGDAATYPCKVRKADRPRRRGVVWVLRDADGRVALVRRPDRGLLGSMLGLPTSDWSEAPDATPPVAADWREFGEIEHVFTHFQLTLEVRGASGAWPGVVWTKPDVAARALPSVFRKALLLSSGRPGPRRAGRRSA